jgi:hypothetical protein
MAINRAPWNALLDDDGSNTVGSVWNKAAIKDVLLDPIDAAFATPVYGTFAILDASGGGLTIGGNGGTYCQIGRLVSFWVHVIFPVTAQGSNVTLTGLPVPCNATVPGGAVTTYGVNYVWHVANGYSNLYVYNATTGAPLTNAQLSASTFTLAGSYLSN